MKAELKSEIAQVRNEVDKNNSKLTYLVADVELLEHDDFQNKKEINRIKTFESITGRQYKAALFFLARKYL